MRSSARRSDKYKAKLSGSITGQRFDALKGTAVSQHKKAMAIQVNIENKVKALVTDPSVVNLPYYIIYANELNKVSDEVERTIIYNKWKDRGLSTANLAVIGSSLFNWWPPTSYMDFPTGGSPSTDNCYARNADYTTCHDAAAASNTPPAGLAVFVGQRHTGTQYVVYRPMFLIDTSALPASAVIKSAELHFYVDFFPDLFPQDLIIQSGLPDFPHNPVVNADYNMNNWSGNYGQLSSTDIVLNDWNIITLTDAGLSLVQSPITKFTVRSSRDINSQSPGANNDNTVSAEGYSDPHPAFIRIHGYF
jgi:hypothetical protein